MEGVGEPLPGGNEDRARARHAHDLADPLAHLWFVAVDGAVAAGGFGLAVGAAVEVGAGVGEQIGALAAEGPAVQYPGRGGC